jgi:hypothetical protein
MSEEIHHHHHDQKVKVESGFGVIWFIGWLFTIGFLQLVWWKALLALIIWPWYLGVAIRLIS